MSRTRLVLSWASSVVLAAALAACGYAAATPPNQQQAEQAACTAIAALAVQAGKLDALDPATATVEDVAHQEAAIQGAWSAVQASLATLSSADKAAVLAAGQAFETTVGGVSPGTSPADQVATIEGAIAPLRATYAEMQNGLGCAGAGASPGAAPGASPSFSQGAY